MTQVEDILNKEESSKRGRRKPPALQNTSALHYATQGNVIYANHANNESSVMAMCDSAKSAELIVMCLNDHDNILECLRQAVKTLEGNGQS